MSILESLYERYYYGLFASKYIKMYPKLREELLSSALLGMVKGVRAFEKKGIKDCPVEKFIVPYVRGACINCINARKIVRVTRYQYSKQSNDPISISHWDGLKDSRIIEDSSDFLIEDVIEDWGFNARQRRIARLLLAGRSVKEVAELMHLRPSNIYYNIKLMQRKTKNESL